MRKTLFVSIAIVMSMMMCSVAIGEESIHRWSIGLNYPGLDIRYFVNNQLGLELRGQFTNDSSVTGIRGIYWFNPATNVILLTGIESDYVVFKSNQSRGHGYAEELFFGLEFFLEAHFSLQVDFGPALIMLKDKESAVSVSGIEYVANIGINWYFAEGK